MVAKTPILAKYGMGWTWSNGIKQNKQYVWCQACRKKGQSSWIRASKYKKDPSIRCENCEQPFTGSLVYLKPPKLEDAPAKNKGKGKGNVENAWLRGPPGGGNPGTAKAPDASAAGAEAVLFQATRDKQLAEICEAISKGDTDKAKLLAAPTPPKAEAATPPPHQEPDLVQFSARQNKLNGLLCNKNVVVQQMDQALPRSPYRNGSHQIRAGRS